ncbi:MAG: UpxY family transcription antiterminator [Acidobacteriota bacterium]
MNNIQSAVARVEVDSPQCADTAAAPARTGSLSGLNSCERGWWAVYTKHQHEKRIADVLMHHGAEVFLASYQETRLWNKRKVTLSLPLFPSYLFVREDSRLRLAVVSTPGVYMIVCQGGKLAVIPAAEINNLRRAMQCPRGIQPHSFLKAGQKVRIVRGVMEGVEGILLRHKGLCHVVLSINMLAQSAVVEVAERDVALAPVDSTRVVQTAQPVCTFSGRTAVQEGFGPFCPGKPLNA